MTCRAHSLVNYDQLSQTCQPAVARHEGALFVTDEQSCLLESAFDRIISDWILLKHTHARFTIFKTLWRLTLFSRCALGACSLSQMSNPKKRPSWATRQVQWSRFLSCGSTISSPSDASHGPMLRGQIQRCTQETCNEL
jgi:hypothetical protein